MAVFISADLLLVIARTAISLFSMIVGETNNLMSGDRFNHKSLRLERTRSNVFLKFCLRRILISNLSNGGHG